MLFKKNIFHRLNKHVFNKKIAKRPINHFLFVFFSILTFIALVFVFFIPPLNKPDEDLHFLKAVAVSRGNFYCQVQNNKPVNIIPKKYYDFTQYHSYRSEEFETKTIVINKSWVNEANSCVLPFMYYLAPGIVIRISEFFNTPTELSFFAGRLTNYVILILTIYISLKSLPKKIQVISLFILSLPMTLFQITSYSKDAYHIIFGLFLINKSLLFSQRKKIGLKNVIIFCSILILFILTRPQYFWFILLILILPLKKKLVVGRKKVKINHAILFVITTLILGLSLMFLIKKQVYLSPYNRIVSLSYSGNIDPKNQVIHLLTHPLSFPAAIIRTLINNRLLFLVSLIGVFGWINIVLPPWVYYVHSGIFLAILLWVARIATVNKSLIKRTFFKNKGIEIIPKRAILTYTYIVILSILSLFLAMYLYATPVGGTVVLGMQGRHLLILIPLLMLIAAKILNYLKRKRK